MLKRVSLIFFKQFRIWKGVKDGIKSLGREYFLFSLIFVINYEIF